MVQLAPAASVPACTQVVPAASRKSAASVPDRAQLVVAESVPVALETVNRSGVLVVPRRTLPKGSAAGESPITGEIPVPVRLTTFGVLGASLKMVSEPGRAPMAVGVKVMPIVQGIVVTGVPTAHVPELIA